VLSYGHMQLVQDWMRLCQQKFSGTRLPRDAIIFPQFDLQLLYRNNQTIRRKRVQN
jgi:hypothetical protein